MDENGQLKDVSWLKGQAVAFTGRMATMTRAEAARKSRLAAETRGRGEEERGLAASFRASDS